MNFSGDHQWRTPADPEAVRAELHAITPLIDLDQMREFLTAFGWRHTSTSHDIEVWRHESAILPRRYASVWIPATRGGWMWGEDDGILGVAITRIAHVQDRSVREVARNVAGLALDAPLPHTVVAGVGR